MLKIEYPGSYNNDNIWFNQINFSKENIKTLRIVLGLGNLAGEENKYALCFNKATHAVKVDDLIFTKAKGNNNQENKVHLFQHIGKFNKISFDNYIKGINEKAVYIYTKNQDLLKLSSKGELLSENKILFVKDLKGSMVPYDPYLKFQENKDL